MSSNKKLYATFSFDSLNIVSATFDYAILDCWLEQEKHVIVLVKRKVFRKMLEGWLNEKEGYFNMYKHFCGVGTVDILIKSEIVDEQYQLLVDDKLTNVRAFIAGEKFFINMEHG